MQGAGAVILALRFTVLKGVIDEIAGPLAGQVVVVPSNPLTIDARVSYRKGNLRGTSWPGGLPAGARWEPVHPGLLADLDEDHYFTTG